MTVVPSPVENGAALVDQRNAGDLRDSNSHVDAVPQVHVEGHGHVVPERKRLFVPLVPPRLRLEASKIRHGVDHLIVHLCFRQWPINLDRVLLSRFVSVVLTGQQDQSLKPRCFS